MSNYINLSDYNVYFRPFFCQNCILFWPEFSLATSLIEFITTSWFSTNRREKDKRLCHQDCFSVSSVNMESFQRWIIFWAKTQRKILHSSTIDGFLKKRQFSMSKIVWSFSNFLARVRSIHRNTKWDNLEKKSLFCDIIQDFHFWKWSYLPQNVSNKKFLLN